MRRSGRTYEFEWDHCNVIGTSMVRRGRGEGRKRTEGSAEVGGKERERRERDVKDPPLTGTKS